MVEHEPKPARGGARDAFRASRARRDGRAIGTRAAAALIAWIALGSGALGASASDGLPPATEPTSAPANAPVSSPPPAATAGPEAGPARIEQKLLLSFLADKSAFTLIDARSPAEFEASHVDGAVNLPIERVAAGSAELPKALEAPIVVYCKTGKRATAVAEKLAGLGYRNVRVLPSAQLMFQDGLVVFNCGS